VPAGQGGGGVPRARAGVLQAVGDGAGVDAVERQLDQDPTLGQESRSALWLLAWIASDRGELGREPVPWR
jgi:hypothetical protein